MKGSFPLPLNVFAGITVSCNISRVPIDFSVSQSLSSMPVTVATTAASCSASGASLKFSFSKSASTEAAVGSAVVLCVSRTPSAPFPSLCIRGQPDRSVRFLLVKHAGKSELVWSGTGHADSNLFSSDTSSRSRQVLSKTDFHVTLSLLAGDSSLSFALKSACASRRS